MFKPAQFASAFPLTGGPVSPEQILAFHRARFGSTRMGPEEDAAAAAAATKAAADKAAADKALADKAAADKAAADKAAADAATDKGFPENTPIAEMTAAQQAAYWKHQSRKHEDTSKARADYDAVVAERDKLKAATLTDSEKAVEAAKAEARKEARLEAAPKLVLAEFKAELKGKRTPEQIQALIAPLDLSKFLTADGEVDTDKVTQYAAGLGPAGTWPDTGQGNRGGSAPGKGISAGRDAYEERRGKKTTTST